MTLFISKSFKFFAVFIAVFHSEVYTYAQSATYQLDVKESKLFWKGTKTVGTKHYGFLSFSSGCLRANNEGKLYDGMFTINMNSITSTEHEKETENQKIATELKGNSFFEVSKYPTTSITIKKISPTAKPLQFRVEGNLTIKNITHPIVFLAMIVQRSTSLHATADLTIDRVKWGIHQEKTTSITDQFFAGIKDKLIADEIPIKLSLVFMKK